MKKSFFPFLLLCLCLGMGLKAEASEELYSRFEDSDIVGFIGDSITHVVYRPLGYVEILEQYYLSRFPEEEIEFRNLGAEGHRTCDILNLFETDPAFEGLTKAVIMLGTNEAILQNSAEEYTANLEALIGKLTASGIVSQDILLLSPPICDQYCAMNYDENGNMRWTYEDKLLEYLEVLDAKTKQWGVAYLNYHGAMAALTEQIQQEDPRNTLTTDCIHLNATGHRLLAYYILQAQGLDAEPLSELSVSKQGEVKALREDLTDVYLGEIGMTGILHSETLPIAAAQEVKDFQAFYGEAARMYGKPFVVKGLQETCYYNVFLGENLLGLFQGKELAEGIDLSTLDTHPQQAAMEQVHALSKQRHQNAVSYRNMWVDITMQRAAYTQEQILARFQNWQTTDQALQQEMRQLVTDRVDDTFTVTILKEGYSLEDLEQEKAQALAQEEALAKHESVRQAGEKCEERARRVAETLRSLLTWIFHP